MIIPLRLAFSLLSRFPIPFPPHPSPQDWGRAVWFFPVVGLAVGGCLALAAAWLDPTPLAAALLTLLWVWCSGGLHLDGLADTADAWIGGMGDKNRMLAIMKDAACGPAGVVSILMVLLVKYSALVVFLDRGLAPWLLLLPAVAGRWAMMVMILTSPYVREQGMGSLFWHHLPQRTSLILVMLLTLILTLLLPWPLNLGLLLALWYWRHSLLTRLGGSTGDTTGATCEGVETLVLAGLVLTHGPALWLSWSGP